MRGERRSYTWTTLVALGLVTVLTVAFTAQGVERLVAAGGAQTAREAAFGVAQANAGTSRTLTATLILAFCAVTAALAIGIARRREGSRHAGIAVFLLLGTVSLGSAWSGFAADPPAENAWLGALNGVTCLAICASLVHPRTAADFDRAETDRRCRADGRPRRCWSRASERTPRLG